VTVWPELVGLFKKAIEFAPSKTVDIVIPNAGVAGPSLVHWLMDPKRDEHGDPSAPPSRVVDVNYLAVFNTVHAAMYYFQNSPGEDLSKSKLIILVSSMGGYNPMASVLNYNSAKWGVRGLFWSLRNIEKVLGEGKPRFRVNLIAPTWVRTNMTRGFVSRFGGDSEAIAEVSDCVDVVLRMASDENVKGRAAAIAPKKRSFDLCDDSEGPGVGKVLSDPEYLKRLGYNIPREAKEPQSQTQPKKATEPQVATKTEDAPPASEPVKAVDPIKADEQAKVTEPVKADEEPAKVDSPHKAEEPAKAQEPESLTVKEDPAVLPAKPIDTPSDLPKEVVNAA